MNKEVKLNMLMMFVFKNYITFEVYKDKQTKLSKTKKGALWFRDVQQVHKTFS